MTVGVEFASKSITVDGGKEIKLQIWDTVIYALYLCRQGRKHLGPLSDRFIRALLEYF